MKPLSRVGNIVLMWVIGVALLGIPATWALAIFFSQQDIKGLMLLAFVAISALAYWQSLRWLSHYVTPVIFLLLFIVSYPARVPVVENNVDLYTISGGYASVGDFSFTVSDYGRFYIVSLVGLAGLLSGMALVWQLRRGFVERPGWNDRRWAVNLGHLIWWYIILSAGVSLICYFLGIDLSGIDPRKLPFRMTGLLHFARTFVLPATGWFLFGLAYDRREYRTVSYLVAFQMTYGVASAYFTLSKAALMYSVLPFIAYLVLRAPWTAESRRFLFSSIFVLSVLLPITYFGALVLREEVYTQQQLSRGKEYKEIVADSIGSDSSFLQSITGTINSVKGRVTGGSELMAILAARPFSFSSILLLVSGQGGDRESGTPEMFLDVFHVQLVSGGGMYSGKAFGLFGVLFLSHSYIVLFLGSAFFAGAIMWLEGYAVKVANQGAAVGLVFWLALCVWESGFDSFVYYPPLLFGMFFLLRRINHRRPRFTGNDPMTSFPLARQRELLRPHA